MPSPFLFLIAIGGGEHGGFASTENGEKEGAERWVTCWPSSATSELPFNCSKKCLTSHVSWASFLLHYGSRFCSSTFCVGSHAKRTDIATGKRRLNSVDTRIVENAQTESAIEIPVTCYELIGVLDKAEKDEIVKSVMALKQKEKQILKKVTPWMLYLARRSSNGH